MILYFVRHGQTDFNVKHILQGSQFDEPLNTDGIKQMEDLIPQLPADFEVIFASPLKRVLMSVEIIKKHFDKPVIIKEELSERDFGTLAGKTWKDIPDGEHLRELDRDQQYDYRSYGGESVADVKNRIEKFLQEAKSSGYNTALIVSSNGILRLLYKLFLNESVDNIDNASIHRFDI